MPTYVIKSNVIENELLVMRIDYGIPMPTPMPTYAGFRMQGFATIKRVTGKFVTF
jgi:hypothetical protein